jgi:hypothetical protein
VINGIGIFSIASGSITDINDQAQYSVANSVGLNTTIAYYFAMEDISMPTFTQTTTSAPPSIQNTAHYQQLFTLNYTKYGINSQGSNFLISYSNGSNAYTWIQSINSTSITFWTSLYYSTDLVDLNVFPQFENLFSSNGFLGYNRTYFNAPLVFPFATDFKNISGFHLDTGYGNFPYNITSNGLSFKSDNNFIQFITNQSYTGNLYGIMSGTFNSSGANDFSIGIFNNTNQGNSNEWVRGGFFGYYNPSSQGFQYPSGNSQNGTSSPYFSLNPTVDFQAINKTIAHTWIKNKEIYTANPSSYYPTDYYGMEIGSHQNMYINVSYYILANVNYTSMPTYTISGGSAFQANATTSSTFSGQSGHVQFHTTPIIPHTEKTIKAKIERTEVKKC